MSIPNKVRLLGNITLDTIYLIHKWPSQGTSNQFDSSKISIGGIGNLIRPLKDHQIDLLIESIVGKDQNGKIIEEHLNRESVDFLLHKSVLPTSHALILSNLCDQERTSFVQWGCGFSPVIPTEVDADWSHISYLDIMSSIDLKELRKHSKVISADLCLSNPSRDVIYRITEQLGYLDYLFISESEIDSYISDIKDAPNFLQDTGLKHLIFHTRKKTYIVDQQQYFVVMNDQHQISNVDVLGAGDMYCANFIAHQLTHNSSLPESALYAHQQTTKLILVRNEKV